MASRLLITMYARFFLIAASAVSSPAHADGGPPVPDPSDLITLVQKAILAVADGNKELDYAALHALGSPAFRADNTADSLAMSFSSLRASGLDLASVQTKIPLTTRPPTLDRNSRLRIRGYYELPKHQVVYDLLYDYDVALNQWQLAGISVEPRLLPLQPELMQPE